MEIQAFKEKVEKISEILQMAITFASDEDMRWNKWAHLTSEGRDIRIECGDYKTKGRFSICGCFPTNEYHEPMHYGPSGSITVAVEKTPENIARDIERRLMPEYLVELKKTQEQAEVSNRYHKARHDNLQKVADHLGENLSTWDGGKNDFISTHLIGIGGKIEAQGEDKVTFMVEVTPDVAIRIIDLVNGND